jgi:hypothetical protein
MESTMIWALIAVTLVNLAYAAYILRLQAIRRDLHTALSAAYRDTESAREATQLSALEAEYAVRVTQHLATACLHAIEGDTRDARALLGEFSTGEWTP